MRWEGDVAERHRIVLLMVEKKLLLNLCLVF